VVFLVFGCGRLLVIEWKSVFRVIVLCSSVFRLFCSIGIGLRVLIVCGLSCWLLVVDCNVWLEVFMMWLRLWKLFS